LAEPSHEYTKLLLASVPVPDPDDRWEDRVVISDGTPHMAKAGDSGAARLSGREE
jgi:hypothetical protein